MENKSLNKVTVCEISFFGSSRPHLVNNEMYTYMTGVNKRLVMVFLHGKENDEYEKCSVDSILITEYMLNANEPFILEANHFRLNEFDSKHQKEHGVGVICIKKIDSDDYRIVRLDSED